MNWEIEYEELYRKEQEKNNDKEIVISTMAKRISSLEWELSQEVIRNARLESDLTDARKDNALLNGKLQESDFIGEDDCK